MMRLALAILRKDARLVLLRGGLLQAGLLGLLLIFMFSLAGGAGGGLSCEAAAAIFWLSSLFCQVLVFNRLYALEEDCQARQGLLLCPAPIQGIWLGKAMAGFLLLLLLQAMLLPATIIFLGQTAASAPLSGLAILLLVDIGLCAAGSLLGAIGEASGRESLLSIILFPLLLPLLLAGTGVGAHVFGMPAQDGPEKWLGLACAFDAIFLGAGLSLFGFLYAEEA